MHDAERVRPAQSAGGLAPRAVDLTGYYGTLSDYDNADQTSVTGYIDACVLRHFNHRYPFASTMA